MIAWPQTLIEDIARRRAVIVLGAGISMNSVSGSGQRPKSWVAFLTEGITKMSGTRAFKLEVKRLIDGGDPLTACEMIKDGLGPQAFSDLCRAEFLDPNFRPAQVHESIHMLDSRFVMTPNFDTIYEAFVSSKQGSPPLVKTYKDKDLAEAVRLPGRLILKIHGTIQQPHDMIFTRSDYATARVKHAAAYEVLKALALTSTFLFLGCGLNDPDIALLFEDNAFRYQFGRMHYMTIPKGDAGRLERRNVIERTRNLKLLIYDPKGGHVELQDSLKTLVSLVAQVRQEISLSQNW